MTHTDLAQKLKTLPGLTDDERADLLTLLNRDANPQDKTYGLVWENKPEQVEEDLRNKLPVLHEVTERRIVAQLKPADSSHMDTGGSGPARAAAASQLTLDLTSPAAEPETAPAPPAAPPHHLLIEGDNLHALTVLNYMHLGQVDVIYIDPPYNTGRDFKYNDSFIGYEDAYRHSKWLSFMHKRLELARTLLKPEGVVFISIDDNEQAQLKLLCDRIFLEENFIVNILWKKRNGPPNDKVIGTVHDYIYAYARDKQQVKLSLKQRTEDQISRYSNPDNHPKGVWTPGDLMANVKGGRYVASLFYSIKNPNTGEEHYPGMNGNWRFNDDKMKLLISRNEIYFGKDGKGKPKLKRFLSEVKDGTAYPSMWTDLVFNDSGTSEMAEIFGNQNKFENPKPSKLILELLKLGSLNKPNALILDFFAGSGTTLHAVMALNAEDGGNRQCILVTNNENNIAEEVCYERNRRVIAGYTNSKGQSVPGLTNNHLHYYQTAYVGRERTLPNKRALMRLATELIAIKESCYVEQNLPGNTIHLLTNDTQTQYVVIVDDEDAIPDAVDLIQDLTDVVAKINVYVFAPGFYPYTDDFADIADRITLVALPEAIYQAYARLLPPMGEPTPVDDADADTPLPTTDLTLFDLNA